jgi:hypothetical protein
MSIEQLDKVDAISTWLDSKVVLTISDHLDWQNEESHLLLLQDKINSYLDFIDSGQLLENYPNALNKKIAIEVVMKFYPTESSLIVLNRFKSFVENESFEFSWRHL